MDIGAGEGRGRVPDITPHGMERSSLTTPSCPECPLADALERKAAEARMAAWAGVVIAILGVVSWTTLGFAGGGLGAIALSLYARTFAPRESFGTCVAGVLALGVLALRLLDLL